MKRRKRNLFNKTLDVLSIIIFIDMISNNKDFKLKINDNPAFITLKINPLSQSD